MTIGAALRSTRRSISWATRFTRGCSKTGSGSISWFSLSGLDDAKIAIGANVAAGGYLRPDKTLTAWRMFYIVLQRWLGRRRGAGLPCG